MNTQKIVLGYCITSESETKIKFNVAYIRYDGNFIANMGMPFKLKCIEKNIADGSRSKQLECFARKIGKTSTKINNEFKKAGYSYANAKYIFDQWQNRIKTVLGTDKANVIGFQYGVYGR